MSETSLDATLAHRRRRLEATLECWLPPVGTHPSELHRAMRYSLLGGGKRIRPLLTYAAGTALGCQESDLDGPACAVELIHGYSLIHDDLPAMDDDDLRRGKPSCHRAFGEAMAILAGDALQSLAFFGLAHDPAIHVPAEHRLKMVEALALASGSRGMAGGQAIDLAAVGQELDLAQLEIMHIHKTGALIRASVTLGALCRKDADPSLVRALDRYAKTIGLAFQIQDDLLDVEGDTGTLGKQRGQDRALDKPTYPSLLGLQETRNKTGELLEQALTALEPLGEAGQELGYLARSIVHRDH